MKQFFNNFTVNPKNDILSGLTVALALVPEAVAFAFVAGIDPLVGLYGAFMMGIITALFGGRPGMISGATGAMAVVMVHMIQKGNEVGDALATPIENLGLQWLFITLLFVGAIQVMAGLFKLGKFVRLIPHPVMMGFVNGLAIVIFLSQLGLFPKTGTAGISFWSDMGSWFSSLFTNTSFWMMMAFVLLTMVIMYFLPKLTKKIPAALVAIIIVAAIVILGNLDMSTVGSFIRDGGGSGLEGGLPNFQFQIFDSVVLDSVLENKWLILSTAFILAAVGLIESLMTLNLIDDMTETRGSGNRECLAQGGANILNGLFGGMGGCAMIGQSIINVESGGRGRLSGAFAALALLGFILFNAYQNKRRNNVRLEKMVTLRTKELKATNTQLKLSNEELARFAYVASHDLKEPLRNITSFTQLLQKNLVTSLKGEALTFIDIIYQNATHMNQLITDTLEFTRLSDLDEPLTQIDLNQMILNVKNDLVQSLDKKEVSILTKQTLPNIQGKYNLIYPIFKHLIENGLTYNESPNPIIYIDYTKNQQEYVFSIKDNGIGIPKKYHQTVFEMFKRLQNREKYAGTGMGLSNCKKIISKWGGKIWIKSNGHKGTTIFFTLPLRYKAQIAIQPLEPTTN